MQNDEQKENNDTNNEIKAVEIDQDSQTSAMTGPSLTENPQVPTSQSTFGLDVSCSDDDEVSEVDSFILDADDPDPVLEPNFLLPQSIEGANLQTVTVDPETHARLEALLEAAGIGKLSTADGKALTDPEVLRKLTSSVSCALDEAAQALHRMRAEQQSQLGNTDSQRSLAEACSDGDVPTVRKLLREGGSVHETTEEGDSLLSLACSAGYYELAQVLLAMKANVEDRGIKGDCTPLMEAASGGYVDIVKLLIAHGADVNAQSSAGNTPLHYAACGGYNDVVQVLIEAEANVEQHNENGHTPLMEAASAGHVGVASILLRNGAGINTHSNEFKESALTLACYKGHLEMVKFLLEAGADQEHKTDEMHTALMEASMDGHVEVARLLLDSGAQVNMPADSFESPLTLAACGGHVELANLLIERGANLEEVNDEGYTPLMEAAREGHEEMVALLLAHDADINAQTEETQETALTLACCGGFLDVADFLITAGADIELGCSTPLMEAAQEGHLELVKYLLERNAEVNATTGTGDTALTYACENGHTDVADVLLQHNAELEHESEGGRTPLMKAARAGHLCTVQFLIGNGADVNRQTTNNDHTVLSLACAGGHLAVVELLLANGADPTHRLKDGSTMVIEAAKGGHTQVVKLLLEYPNRLLMNTAPELPPISTNADSHLESRVPIQGLANIVPPSQPDSHPVKPNNLTTTTTICEHLERKKAAAEKDLNIPVNQAVNLNKTGDQIWQNIQKSFTKKPTSTGHIHNIDPATKTNKTSNLTTAELSPQLNENGMIADLLPEEQDLKAGERLEAIISNVMAKELINTTSTREEQILRKQQILEELQKVERELQEKAQQQLLITAQHQQQQQQQQQLQQVLPPSSRQPLHKVLQKQLDEHKKRLPQVPCQAPSTAMVPVSTSVPMSVQMSVPSSVLTSVQTSVPTSVPMSVSMSVPSSVPTSVPTSVVPTSVPSSASAATPAPPSSTSDQHSMSNNLDKQASKSTTSSDTSIKPNICEGGNVSNGNSPGGQAATDGGASDKQKPPPNKPAAGNGNSNTAKTNGGQQSSSSTPTSTSVQSHNGGSQSSQPSRPPPPTTQPFIQLSNLAQSIPLPQPPALPGPAPPKPAPLLPGQQQQIEQQLQLQLQQQQQQQSVMSPQPFVLNETQRTTLQNLILRQQQETQQLPLPALQFPQLQLTPQQQDHLFQVLSQQQFNPQPLQQNKEAVTVQQQQSQQQPQQQFVATSQQQGQQPAQSLLQHAAGLTPNLSHALFNQQQHHQFLQQQQQAQLLQQQLHNIKPPAAPGTQAQKPALQRKAKSLLPTQQMASPDPLLGIETITPPPSTPLTPNPSPASPDSISPLYAPIDLDAQTESNHDTALTLACAGGHAELVTLLLSKGADIEHRDKKGFTPLILAATAGHVDVVEILLEHGADIEAQSERTKDTPLSLACSGGRYEVVELLLSRAANKEHRNVSDYTPLSLAASGGFVNIIKLLLSHGAEINSRTGSKLGISPLMLAAMNGHTAAVKLLLDMGSDINAQIETNRNTALTLACFQGRHEVVSLLVDRRANIEHRAKTGLTPLMEAASGGYVEVGRVLLDKGADVNAPPVPSSRDTALTIAADKGHYRFVELLLSRHASVDVKNKKGNSPLWLACHGGHLDVVQLLVTAGADIDSQDNRKVSCLMAAFRKGHIKVVKWMVKHVNQFPSDAELSRYIATITDKELQKKCQQCMEIIVSAKDRQAAEAYKIASDLLEELDKERQHEENRKAQAAKKREKKKKKKKEKQGNKEKEPSNDSKNSSPEPESEDSQPQEKEEKEESESSKIVLEPPSATTTSTLGLTLPISEPIYSKAIRGPKRQLEKSRTSRVEGIPPLQDENQDPQNNKVDSTSVSRTESKKNKRNRKEKAKDRQATDIEKINSGEVENGVATRPERHERLTGGKGKVNGGPGRGKNRAGNAGGGNRDSNNDDSSLNFTPVGDLDDFGKLPTISDRDMEKLRKNGDKTKATKSEKVHIEKAHVEATTNVNVLSVKTSPGIVNSPKRGQKKEDGWKEVIRKSKKVQVPSSAISRVIGRGGCNINAIREVSGANIDVEKNKGSGDRTITIKGSAEATRQAHALITALITDPDKDLVEILPKSKSSKPPPENKSLYFIPPADTQTTSTGNNPSQQSSQGKGSNKTLAPRLQQQAALSAAGNASRAQNAQQSAPNTGMVWGTSPAPGASSPRRNPGKVATVAPYSIPTTAMNGPTSVEKSGVTRQLFSGEKPRGGFGSPNNLAKVSMASMSAGTRTTASPTFQARPDGGGGKGQHGNRHNSPKTLVPGHVKLLQRPASAGGNKHEPQPLPIISNQTASTITTQTVSSSNGPLNMSASGEFSPFDNFFSNAADQLLGKKDESVERMNFASVAAAGVVAYPGTTMVSPIPHSPDPLLQAKAPGFKPSPGPRMAAPHDMSMGMKGQGFPMPPQMLDMNLMSSLQGLHGMPGFPMNQGLPPNQFGGSPNVSPRSSQSSSAGLSPRSSSSGFDPPGSQKEEYTTPDQPMTLPKISSSLNPNAPDFTSRSLNNPGGISGPGGPPNMPGGMLYQHPMYQQALAQQLLSFVNNMTPPNQNPSPSPTPGGSSNPPGGPPSQSPGPAGSQDQLGGNVPSNQQEFYQNFANLMHQFALQNQTPGSPGVGPSPTPGGFTAPTVPRPFSPSLPLQGRPNSAPSIGGMLPRDGASPTPIGPPRTNSPLPPSTPPLSDIIRPNLDDRRQQPRPIGGERSMRKTPGPTAGVDPDYGDAFWNLSNQLNMDWGTKTSASLQTSVMQTSVISGSTMSTNPGTGSGGEALNNPIPSSMDDLPDQNFPLYVQSSGIPPMQLFNGVGHYGSGGFGSTPMSGGSGDGMQTMWSPPVDSTSTEDLQDTGGIWNWTK